MKGRDCLSSVWSVVLAGGDGERTRAFIRKWLGFSLPKQYCTFVGTRSMLQHTWDRAGRLSNPHRIVTVVARGHQLSALGAARDFSGETEGTLLFQPRNCDTAPGLLLPLTYIKACDPQAAVAIFPADHFVFPEDRFIALVRRAARAVEFLADRVILLGAAPTHAEVDYGWVLPGDIIGWSAGSEIRSIRAFHEKPDCHMGKTLIEQGALWNTFVMVGKVETFWQIGWTCFPEIMKAFDGLEKAIGTGLEGTVLQDIYRSMPSRNFSRDALESQTGRLGVMAMDNILWSDWGRPERIVESLDAIGKRPAFSQTLVNPVMISSKPSHGLPVG